MSLIPITVLAASTVVNTFLVASWGLIAKLAASPAVAAACPAFYGLQWPDYLPAHLDVQGNLQIATLSVSSSMWRGKRNEDAKNEFRQATIPVIGILAKLLDAHYIRSGKPAAGRSSETGTAMLCVLIRPIASSSKT